MVINAPNMVIHAQLQMCVECMCMLRTECFSYLGWLSHSGYLNAPYRWISPPWSFSNLECDRNLSPDSPDVAWSWWVLTCWRQDATSEIWSIPAQVEPKVLMWRNDHRCQHAAYVPAENRFTVPPFLNWEKWQFYYSKWRQQEEMHGIYGMHPKLSRENEAGKNIYTEHKRLQRNFSCGGFTDLDLDHTYREQTSLKAIKWSRCENSTCWC